MQGIVLIDKPEGFTSFDVVAVMRGVAGTKKVGHAGTLDPMATGVLPILIGRATKLSDLLPVQDKRYTARIRLGIETDTLDRTGTVTAQCEPQVGPSQVKAALEQFRGTIAQTPPMYSAVQKNGVRLYDLARKGVEVQRDARQVTIYSLELVGCDPDQYEYELDVHCSKGTYIRSLCADLGQALGCGAMLTELRRTEACGFSIDQCAPLDRARGMALSELLLPVELALKSYPELFVSDKQAVRFQNGGALDFNRLRLPECSHGLYRMKNRGRCFALGEADGQLQQVKLKCLFDVEK